MSDEMTVHTWADDFGLWHARVTVSTDEERANALRVGRRAILAELRERMNGPSTKLDSRRVKTRIGTSTDTSMTIDEYEARS